MTANLYDAFMGGFLLLVGWFGGVAVALALMGPANLQLVGSVAALIAVPLWLLWGRAV